MGQTEVPVWSSEISANHPCPLLVIRVPQHIRKTIHKGDWWSYALPRGDHHLRLIDYPRSPRGRSDMSWMEQALLVDDAAL